MSLASEIDAFYREEEKIKELKDNYADLNKMRGKTTKNIPFSFPMITHAYIGLVYFSFFLFSISFFVEWVFNGAIELLPEERFFILLLLLLLCFFFLRERKKKVDGVLQRENNESLAN